MPNLIGIERKTADCKKTIAVALSV